MAVHEAAPETTSGDATARAGDTDDWRQKAGWALLVVGAVLVILGYIGVSGADTEVLQLPYLASGGIGGLTAVAMGSALLVSADVRHDRERLGRIEGELLELQDLVRSLSGPAGRPTTR
ncbi:MAG: hypothetical protein ACRDYV_02025 [Acidimicrobiia bacterium]